MYKKREPSIIFYVLVSAILITVAGCAQESIDSTPNNNETIIVESTACTSNYYPVCGTNGIEYSNSCLAEEAGITIDYQGPCKYQLPDANESADPTCPDETNPICNTITSSVTGPIGPGGGGWFTSLAIHPNKKDIIYIGTDLGGMYKSVNGGKSFDFINNGLNDLVIQQIVIDQTNPDTIYLATTGGVYKSTNAGDSWTLKRTGFPPTSKQVFSQPVNTIAIDPTDSNILFAGIGFGLGVQKANSNGLEYGKGTIYKSKDAGQTWKKINTGSNKLLTMSTIFRIAIDPSDSDQLFATTSDGIYRSVDGGINWRTNFIGLSRQADTRGIAISPTDPKILYITVFKDGVYKSTDSGQSWNKQNTGLETGSKSQYTDIIIHPNNPDKLYTSNFASKQGVSQSSDAGKTWQHIMTKETVQRVHHPFPSFWTGANVIISQSNPNNIIYSDSGNVFKSSDQGKNWESLHTNPSTGNQWQSTGLENSIINTIDISPTDPDTIYAGYTNLGLFKSTDKGQSFKPVKTPDPTPDSSIEPMTISTNNAAPGTVYVSYGDTQSDGLLANRIERSTDFGKSWTRIDQDLPQGPAGGETTNIVIDQPGDKSTEIIYITRMGHGIFKSLDNGNSWFNANNGLPLPIIDRKSTLALHPTERNILYLTSNKGVFKTSDGGKNWDKLYYSNADSFIIDPSHPSTMYLTNKDSTESKNGIYKSVNSGESWLQVFSNEHINELSIDPINPNILYAGTNVLPHSDQYKPKGLFKSTDNGNSWRPFKTDLPHPLINVITVDPSNPSYVYIGTDGGGLFRIIDEKPIKDTVSSVNKTTNNNEAFTGSAIENLDSRFSESFTDVFQTLKSLM